jgi:hypothetical protein
VSSATFRENLCIDPRKEWRRNCQAIGLAGFVEDLAFAFSIVQFESKLLPLEGFFAIPYLGFTEETDRQAFCDVGGVPYLSKSMV